MQLAHIIGVMRYLALALACSACTGHLGASAPPPTPPDVDAMPDTVDAPNWSPARASFEQNVNPLITATCNVCHGGSDAAVAWMKPDPDIYTTVMSWPHLVDVSAPGTSMILTKGAHEGPVWSVDQAATILTWLQLEHDERPVDPTIETHAIDVVQGANTLALDAIGSTGSSITFTAQKLTYGLYMSHVSIVAGPAGIHINHPLFVTWVMTTPSPDPADSFDTVELDLAAGGTTTIGGGLLMLENVPMNAQLSVSFKSIGPSVGSGTTTLPGCKAVSTFTTNAQPLLSANCVSCHGGANSTATNAVDMTKVNDLTTAGQTTACGQILSRVNLVTPAQSGILLAPDPNSGVSHLFKFSTTALPNYQTKMNTWITAEKP
jgi:hypothetical protein